MEWAWFTMWWGRAYYLSKRFARKGGNQAHPPGEKSKAVLEEQKNGK